MRLFKLMVRYVELYGLFAAALAGVVMLAAASQARVGIDAEHDRQLTEKLTSYTATLEGGTVGSRAMGAIILFGEVNHDAKLLALGKLPPNTPAVSGALGDMRELFLTDVALLMNREGVVVAYSSASGARGTGENLSFRPYAQLALHGIPNVYPLIGSISRERGIFLAAPVRAGLDRQSEPIGAVAVRVNAEKIDELLRTWAGGPSALVSPQGVVFSSSREDWLLRLAGDASPHRLEQIARSRQFGDHFDRLPALTLPFRLGDAEVELDGDRYVVRSRPVEWGDPAGDWTLVLLDRRPPWWAEGRVLATTASAALAALMLLFWLWSVARNAVLQDVTHRELAIAAATFESSEGVVITDAEGTIMKVNHAFTAITGYSNDEAVGRNPSLLSSGRHDQAFFARMWGSMKHEQGWRGEIWNRRKNGEIYPEQLAITPIRGGKGEITNYVGIFSDITQRKATEQEILHLAFYDALTGLPNRRLLNERLEHAMAVGKRDGRYGALMFMDMDKFKQLNDTHGHGMGDLLLIEVARRITRCVREADTVARFGGDEFVVTLGELDTDREKSAEQAAAVAEKIRGLLAEPYTLTLAHGDATPVTVEHHCSSSIGVVLFLGQAVSAEEILKRADIAMYQAKTDGRNRICFHEA